MLLIPILYLAVSISQITSFCAVIDITKDRRKHRKRMENTHDVKNNVERYGKEGYEIEEYGVCGDLVGYS